MADYNSDQALAAEYALGVLQGAERRVFEDRMTREPELRAMYAAWADDFSVLDPDEVTPPAGLKAALDVELFGEPAPWWHKFHLMGGGLVAAMGLLVAVVLVIPNGPDSSAILAANGVAATASLYTDDRTVQVALDVSTPPAGKDHELWIIAKDSAPVSLGILKNGEVNIPDGFVLAGAVLAITVENKGGSPTGAPTTTPILVAEFIPA